MSYFILFFLFFFFNQEFLHFRVLVVYPICFIFLCVCIVVPSGQYETAWFELGIAEFPVITVKWGLAV